MIFQHLKSRAQQKAFLTGNRKAIDYFFEFKWGISEVQGQVGRIGAIKGKGWLNPPYTLYTFS